MDYPLTSVVIPVHNGARYLGEAIESVLAQYRVSVEIIVVDDGSNDASSTVARSYAPRVVCRSQPNRMGPGAARNLGVALAQGDFVAFLDADDLWEPTKLLRQLTIMRAEPRPDLVFGAVKHFISPDLDPESAARLHCPEGLKYGYIPSAMLARRDAFERVGPFREDLRVGEAIDWMVRARDLGLHDLMIPDHLVSRRLHASNLGVTRRRDRSDFARVVKASLDRRRAALQEAG
jgi:glycosyltransferase involved in cell wall biosynthesis